MTKLVPPKDALTFIELSSSYQNLISHKCNENTASHTDEMDATYAFASQSSIATLTCIFYLLFINTA